ncbi:DUF4910 domain-containing protein [Planctomycetota bacterium]
MPNLFEADFDKINFTDLVTTADELLRKLFPICRSITGDGVRQTLNLLRDIVDFELHEIPSGSSCFDWTVPREWNIHDAYIEDAAGKKIVDFRNNNLHVVNYSVAVDCVITFEELAQHLFTLPDLPDAIPYRTTYYNENWGFCLSHNQLQGMDRNAEYHVKIDATLQPGSLTFGERNIDGVSGQEFLISTYCCHPSLANDNISGIVLWTLLMRQMLKCQTRHTYRFVIVPETIGALAYLAKYENDLQNIRGGFVLTSVAGPGLFGYKRSFIENNLVDRVAAKTFKELNLNYIEYDFDGIGADERQYSSPGFRIPIGTICKDKHNEYKYYHTSFDNLDFISAEHLVDTLKLYLMTIEKLEMNLTYRSCLRGGEAMFGRRKLYPNIGGVPHKHKHEASAMDRLSPVCESRIEPAVELDAMRWLMFYCDGGMTLMDIAEKNNFPVKQLYRAAERLRKQNLVEIVNS